MAKSTEELNIKITGNSAKGRKALKQTEDQLGKVGKKAKGVGASLKAFKGNWLAITAAVTGSALAIKKFIDLAAEQEKQQRTLAAAMKQAGTFTEAAFQENLNYASSLQKMTVFGDEAIIGVQRMLTNFGVQGEAMKGLTKATLDLASAKGMDLKAAADLVAKSVGSSTNALTRYGIEVTGAAGSTERAQMAVENITKLFGGAAAAEAETFAGMMTQTKNIMGDLGEEVGAVMIETFLPMLKTFKEWIATGEGMEEIGDAFKTLAEIVAFAFEIIRPLLNIIIETIKAIVAPLVATGKAAMEAAEGDWTLAWETIKAGGLDSLESMKKIGDESVEIALSAADRSINIWDAWTTKRKKQLNTQDTNVKKSLNNQFLAFKDSLAKTAAEVFKAQDLLKESSAIFVDAIVDNVETMKSNSKKVYAAIVKGFGDMIAGKFKTIAKEQAVLGAIALLPGPPSAATAPGHFAAAGLATAAAATAKALSGSLAATISAARGADFVTEGPQMMLVGDNPSGRERVTVTPEEAGEGASIVIENLNVQTNNADDLVSQLFEIADQAGARLMKRGAFA